MSEESSLNRWQLKMEATFQLRLYLPCTSPSIFKRPLWIATLVCTFAIIQQESCLISGIWLQSLRFTCRWSGNYYMLMTSILMRFKDYIKNALKKSNIPLKALIWMWLLVVEEDEKRRLAKLKRSNVNRLW